MKAFDLGQLRKTARVNDPSRSYSQIHRSPLKNSTHQNASSVQNYQTYYLSRWGKNIETKSQQTNKQNSKSSAPWVNIGQGIYSVAIGQEHVLILNNKNQCFAYGNNSYGQLAQQSEFVTRPSQISAFKDMKIVAVYSGAYHSLIQNAKGQLYAFGLNLKGQLGIGSFSSKRKPSLVSSLLPGGFKNPKANFFIETIQYKKNLKKSNSRSRNDSQLANIENIIEKFDSQNQEPNQYDPSSAFLLNCDQSVCKVACGPLHTVALTNKNRLFVCGYGQKYALGTANSKTLCSFQQVKIRPNCNSNTSNATSNSSNSGNSRIEKIECGVSCTAVLMGGKVYISGKFGGNTFESFASVSIVSSSISGTTEDVFDFKICEKSMIFLTKKGDIYQFGECCRENGQKYILQIPKKIEKLPMIKQIFCGNNEFFALSENKTMYGWGDNKHCQVTALTDEKYIPSPKSLKVPIPCSSESINIVSSNGTTFLLSTKPMEIDYEKFRQEISSCSKQQKQCQDRKRQKPQRSHKISTHSNICGTQQKNMLNDMGIKPRIFNTNMEIDFNQIVFEKQISEGGYGVIYKGIWRQTTVAIKMFKIQAQNAVKDFFSQCAAMQVLRHPNIVMFLGACTKPPNFAIVLEYCSRGSLWSTIQNLELGLSWEDRRKFALQTAKGVHYLHSCSPPIIHRDLKSLNLLLDDSYHVKLADFGWTKNLDNYMTGKIGTYQWMAPQVIASQKYSEKADVFSYGIILWEIASRQPPFKHLQGLQVSIQVLNNDLRPTIPKKTPQGFAKLMKRCWDRDPQKRPSFKQIIKDLQSMKF